MEKRSSILDWLLADPGNAFIGLLLVVVVIGGLFGAGVVFEQVRSNHLASTGSFVSYEQIDELQQFWYLVGVRDTCMRNKEVFLVYVFGQSPMLPDDQASEICIAHAVEALNLGWYETSRRGIEATGVNLPGSP